MLGAERRALMDRTSVHAPFSLTQYYYNMIMHL